MASSHMPSWKEVIRRNHWGYLLETLNTQKIVDDLFEGFEGKPVIGSSTMDEILGSTTKKGANRLLLKYLYDGGTLETFENFCQVLCMSAKTVPVHLEVFERLVDDPKLPLHHVCL